MPRQISIGQLLVLAEEYDSDGASCAGEITVARAMQAFDMTTAAREYFLDENGDVKDDDVQTPAAFVVWLQSNGYIVKLEHEYVAVGYCGGVNERLICRHERTLSYVAYNSMYPFGEMLTVCEACRIKITGREATEEEFLTQSPYLRHPSGRKYTDEEYREVLTKLAEQRERDAEEAAAVAEQRMAQHAEEIMATLDMATLLSAAGIVPHAGCPGTVDDIEASQHVPEDAEVTISTVMHNSPSLRLHCKRCGQHFAIA